MIKISVIVPVYQVESYLVQCLESIVKQTLEEIEIIVVDEGDQDRCREIIDYYEKSDPRVVAIHEHNGGYGASVNKGIERARGEYIGIVESDDYIEPDMYEKLYERAEKWHSDIVKASFEYVADNRGLHPDDARDFLMRNLPQDTPFAISEFPYLLASHPSIWAGIYKTEFLRKHLFITAKGSGYVDVEFYFDTYCSAESIVYFPDVFYHWRLDNATASTNNWNPSVMLDRWEKNMQKLENSTELIRKIGSCVASKIGVSFLRRYVTKEPVPSLDEVKRTSQCLQMITDEQIAGAPLLTDQEKDDLRVCRDAVEEYYADIMARRNPPAPESDSHVRLRRILEKAVDPNLLEWIFWGFAASLMLLSALQFEVLSFVLPALVCMALSYCCLILLAVFAIALILLYAAKVIGKIIK